MYATNEKELAHAIKNGASEIVVEFDFKRKIVKIKGTEHAVWAVCVIAIGVAVVSIMAGGTLTAGTAGTAAPLAGGVQAFCTVPAASVAVSALGLPTTITAVGIALAGGGVGVLSQLRDYRLVEVSDEKAILYKK